MTIDEMKLLFSKINEDAHTDAANIGSGNLTYLYISLCISLCDYSTMLLTSMTWTPGNMEAFMSNTYSFTDPLQSFNCGTSTSFGTPNSNYDKVAIDFSNNAVGPLDVTLSTLNNIGVAPKDHIVDRRS